MVLVEQDRSWEIRSHSPYMNDTDDKKVMDLSNYNSASPMMVCCGGASPVHSHHHQDTVLRLGPILHHHAAPNSPNGSSRGSSSPQPGRTVITSVSSLQHPSSSTSPIHYKPYYIPAGSPMTIPASSVRPLGLTAGPQLTASAGRKKKLPQPIPEECKDDAYWERRKRNNESAKRSRELRRNKEMLTAERVNHLESENLQLRTEVAMLRNEVEKLRQLLIPKSSISS